MFNLKAAVDKAATDDIQTSKNIAANTAAITSANSRIDSLETLVDKQAQRIYALEAIISELMNSTLDNEVQISLAGAEIDDVLEQVEVRPCCVSLLCLRAEPLKENSEFIFDASLGTPKRPARSCGHILQENSITVSTIRAWELILVARSFWSVQHR